jgi:hypothetical protein
MRVIKRFGTVASILAMTLMVASAAVLQAQVVVGHSSERSGDDVVLRFDLADGEQLSITLQDGKVLLNGVEVGAYARGSEFAESWGTLADEASALSTNQLLESVQQLKLLEANEAQIAVSQALAELKAAQAVVTDVAIASEARGTGISIAVDEPVRQIISRLERIPTPGTFVVQEAEGSSSFVSGVLVGATNLLAMYIALAFMGLGFLFFAPHQLETVSDTVWHSFGRSFLAGLFAQPLLLPVFGMMVVGLVLTVVGVLVLPFAILGFAAALLLAAAGGFIAVARGVGEIYLRRKMARGDAVNTWGSFRYIVYGLLGVLAIWLPVILLGWIPVAGNLLMVAAGLTTWILATAGFGATIISRAGLRGTFVRQMDLALTDEQYWTADQMPVPPHRRQVPRSGL